MDPEEAGDATASPASPFPARPGLYDALEDSLLGGGRRYTRLEVAEATGVDLDRLTTLWRALGFPSAADDERLFVDADIEAVTRLRTLLDSGLLQVGGESALVRTMGRTFARLAEWEIGLLSSQLAGVALQPAEGDQPDEELTRVQLEALSVLATDLLPVVRDLQDYVWRRHLTSAAGRAMLTADEGTASSVGFADIVGFTRTSRKLSSAELGSLVETFEATASEIVTAQGGRVIKTIGDEVLFALDEPHAAARVALDLARRHLADDAFPEVRVGLAHGPVLARLGDVFGETVNVAARLTSLARPGTVLVDRRLAETVAEEFRVRRAPTERVRGYSRLECWALKDVEHPPNG